MGVSTPAGLCLTLAALAGLTACSASATPARSTPGGDLSAYESQELDWGRCPEAYPELNEAGAECARVTVPLDYAEPDGRTIELAISRVAARDTDRGHGILLSNTGGPGGTGLDFTHRVGTALGDAAAGEDGLRPVPCADEAVRAYLRDGALPAEDVTCRQS
ncbi:hypothetical protein E1265_35865 [Streptomyces sp. 8K308]|uniref:alpha/beta hydrolase n=1 Tax=Streptomyces sp. 8K308 TaxID=2530388 RepID=UPI00105119C4|nr:alpha/beta hydrolase [Streptomyces sp. 8K308]TDC04600.1 hypothetical protein E1265_35865 [Streptomyces sp. 8K308]